MRVPFSSYLMQRGSKRIRIIHHRAHRVHRGGRERGSYFFKNSLSLGLFLRVLCDLRGEFSEKFSHVQQISTISTRRFNHKFNYFLCFCTLKIIAAIEDPPVIVKILSHLGLPTRAPPRAPARQVDLFQTSGEAQTAERPKPMETLALSASKR